jgi:hypothetical protein
MRYSVLGLLFVPFRDFRGYCFFSKSSKQLTTLAGGRAQRSPEPALFRWPKPGFSKKPGF